MFSPEGVSMNAHHNLRLIEAGIDGERYPSLSAYLNNSRSRLKADLMLMLSYMDTHKPTTSAKRQRLKYWAIPMRTLLNAGGSSRTWQSHVVFFATTGLLVRIKPNAQSVNDKMHDAYQKAREQDRNPMSFYSCRRYTRQLLSEAEAIAAKYREQGVNLSDIRKADVVALFGQAVADVYYQDKRTESVEDQRIVQLILQQVARQIERQGYALREKAVNAVNRQLPEEELAAVWGKLQHAARQFASICKGSGYEYRRVRREDHERWGLPYGAKIVVKGQSDAN